MNSQSNTFRLVIEKHDTANEKVIEISDLVKYLNDNAGAFKFWALIEHNFDNTREHYHLVLVTYNQYSARTIGRDLIKSLMCNECIVSYDVSRDLVHDVRYLTHKDNYEKAQYTDDLVTTPYLVEYDEITKKQINPFELDFESLKEIIKDCDYNLTCIYSQIGIKQAIRCRNIINDILKEHKESCLFKIKNDKKGE